MTDFSVKPDALDNYAEVLDSLKVDKGLERKYLLDYGSYADKWVELGQGEGGVIFMSIVGKTHDIHEQLVAQNSAITTCLFESADGLTKAADVYRKQDTKSAQHIDSVYKPAGVPESEVDVNDSAPLADPSAKLTEPGEEGAIPDMVQQILDGAGYFSESDLVLKILGWCGLDVMGWVKDKFVGDFKAIAHVKNALEKLGEFDEVAATNVAEGADIMLKSWTGNAATGARGYFTQLANALSARSSALSKLSSNYGAILVGIQEAGSTLEGAITGAIDAAIEAAAAVAAAGCLQEIPGVDVLADIIGGWRVVKVIDKVHEVFGTWNWIWSAHEGILAIITGLVGTLTSAKVEDKLPKIGYYDAAQGPAPKYDDGNDVPPGHGGPR